MLVKFTDDLVLFVQSINPPLPPDERATFTVMTPEGPQKMIGQRSSRFELGLPQVEEIPEWLRNALLEGSHVFMKRKDWVTLPEEVRRHADVLT
jgi:hypothetical protein